MQVRNDPVEASRRAQLGKYLVLREFNIATTTRNLSELFE
jgi:hypothetical protein